MQSDHSCWFSHTCALLGQAFSLNLHLQVHSVWFSVRNGFRAAIGGSEPSPCSNLMIWNDCQMMVRSLKRLFYSYRTEWNIFDFRWFTWELCFLTATRTSMHFDTIRKDNTTCGCLLSIDWNTGYARQTTAIDIVDNIICKGAIYTRQFPKQENNLWIHRDSPIVHWYLFQVYEDRLRDQT